MIVTSIEARTQICVSAADFYGCIVDMALSSYKGLHGDKFTK